MKIFFHNQVLKQTNRMFKLIICIVKTVFLYILFYIILYNQNFFCKLLYNNVYILYDYVSII